VAGKLDGCCAGAVPAAEGHTGHLFFIVDKLTGWKFPVDSGAVISLVPHQSDEVPSGPTGTESAAGADRARTWFLAAAVLNRIL
jgi:hypothetical protein